MEPIEVVGVVPYVFCADAGATADWCVAVLGFRERARWTNDDGAVSNVELQVGTSEVWLDGPAPDGNGARGSWTGFLVTDVDAVYDRICATGHAADPPVTRDFGVRELTVSDPEGHAWGFVQRL